MRPPRRIPAHRCSNGCLWLYEHLYCPNCRTKLERVDIVSAAVLVSHTTVRVNPTGKPIRLGVARTTAGATTLCIIRGAVRGNGRDRVVLVLRDGRFHALGRSARLDFE